ncbi:MAG TPA: thioredoxin domain-containing protein [Zeimonas sp.]|nr:thioredoxin domain-containing protein [Zeimonas sp.]
MPNRLAHETSPYLRQHADNPLDWYPWGEEALERAAREGRPILLSIGYSACHWCHVMAHESFEDPDIAALVDRHFVAIKVDREERPDLDQIYQAALQAITQRGGGWPLTMFLTPDGKPFYGGTYFPRSARHGMPGFDGLLARIAWLWDERRDELLAQGEAVARLLNSIEVAVRASAGAGPDATDATDAADATDATDASTAGGGVDTAVPAGRRARAPGAGRGAAASPAQRALDAFAPRAAGALRAVAMPAYDRRWGGFGGAPKFPQPALLAALLHEALRTGDGEARDAVTATLVRMAEGGLYDHLGGGFFRYSVDARWEIPHFEKMLYDNGPLLRLYARAARLDAAPPFRDVCAATAQWAIREMQGAEGGYYGSRDADSEGGEGRFYLWDRGVVARELGEDYAPFAARYGLDEPPNFEGVAWHLRVARPVGEVAARLGLSEAQAAVRIERARKRLFALRETRVHPELDDKVLTGWNALTIEGMALAGRVLAEPRWSASAREALDFLRSRAWRDGRLLASCKDGRAHLNAYLDDHAFLLGALLETMQHGVLRIDDLHFACALADALLDRFEDREHGGFFFTSHDHERLMMRPKSAIDTATMSGNGAAALHLQRLGHLVGELRYLDAARRAMACFASMAREAPHACATLVTAISEYAAPPPIVVLGGPEAEALRWQEALAAEPIGDALVFVPPAASVDALPVTLAHPAGVHAVARVCRGAHCLLPIDSLDALRATLREGA